MTNLTDKIQNIIKGHAKKVSYLGIGGDNYYFVRLHEDKFKKVAKEISNYISSNYDKKTDKGNGLNISKVHIGASL